MYKVCTFVIYSPSGWDSIKKINIMNEHLKGIHPEDNFDDHIIKPIQRKVKSLYMNEALHVMCNIGFIFLSSLCKKKKLLQKKNKNSL